MKKLLLLSLFLSFAVFSSNFIAVQSTTPHLSKSDYSLSLLDSETQKNLLTIAVAEDLNKTSHWFLSDSGQYFVFYIDQRGNKKAQINIYNSSDLKLVTRIETEKLLPNKKAKLPQLLEFNQDESKLLFLSKINRKLSNLNIYELSNKQLNNKLQISNKIDDINLNLSTLVISGKQGSEGWVSIVDLENNKLLLEQSQKKTKYQVQQDNSHVFIKKDNKSNKKARYSVDVYDFKQEKALQIQLTSNQQPHVVISPDRDKSYIALNSEEFITIYGMINNQLITLAQEKSKTQLKDLYLLANSLILLQETSSGDELVIYDLKDFQQSQKIQAPIEFDLISHNNDNILWLKGKKLASIDLVTGKALGVAPIGSTGAKVQKVLVGVTMAAISTSLAYAVFKGDGFDNIDFMPNSKKDKVFVSSSVTNDISIFTAPDLKNKKLINVRENVFGLFKNKSNNIVGISESMINFFDENELEPFKIRRFQKLLGIDLNNLIAYVLLNKQIHAISLNSSETESKFNIKNAIEVFIP